MMMINGVRLCFGLLALGLGSASAAPLWELDGGRVTLLGSVHFLRADDAGLGDAVAAAFENADVLALELDAGSLDPLAAASTMAELAAARPGERLRDRLSDEEWKTLSALSTELGMPIELLESFEPWYAALMITQVRLLQLGFDPALGVEGQLAMEAGRRGLPTVGMETLDQQLGALDRLSPEAQRRFLAMTMEEAATAGEMVDEVVAAWRASDTEALEASLLEGLRDNPELYRRLIVERNRRFTNEILEMAEDGRDHLVVMGVLHLVGPDSVLRMLEDAGLGARPVGRRDAPAGRD